MEGLLLIAGETETKLLVPAGANYDYFACVEVGDEMYSCGFAGSYGEGGLDRLLMKMDGAFLSSNSASATTGFTW